MKGTAMTMAGISEAIARITAAGTEAAITTRTMEEEEEEEEATVVDSTTTTVEEILPMLIPNVTCPVRMVPMVNAPWAKLALPMQRLVLQLSLEEAEEEDSRREKTTITVE